MTWFNAKGQMLKVKVTAAPTVVSQSIFQFVL